MRYEDIKTPEDMIEYMIDCTLATVESMIRKKSTPRHGEFERQCLIAQKGIDYLGRDYSFKGCRASDFSKSTTAFDYYTNERYKIMKYNLR
jgi:hypothetical protein